MNDLLSNEFKKNVYLKPDEYLNGWAKKCGWKATLVYDSLWRHADKERMSFPSIELMSEEHGVHRMTIIRGIKTLEEYGLLRREQQKNEKGKFICNTYFLTDKSKWHEPVVADIDHGTRGRSQRKAVVAHSDYKDTHTKDTHIHSIEEIGEKDFQEIADKYKIPIAFIRSKYDDMLLWAGERPGNAKLKGRNWKLTLMKWVKNDAIKLAQTPKKGGMIYVESQTNGR